MELFANTTSHTDLNLQQGMNMSKINVNKKIIVIVVGIIASIGLGFVLGTFYEKSKHNVEKIDISPYAVFKKIGINNVVFDDEYVNMVIEYEVEDEPSKLCKAGIINNEFQFEVSGAVYVDESRIPFENLEEPITLNANRSGKLSIKMKLSSEAKLLGADFLNTCRHVEARLNINNNDSYLCTYLK